MLSIVQELLISIWATFVEMAPYLLLGLTFAGILHVVFSKDLIVRHLGRNSIGSVIKAAVLGVPLPLCSCGVIPTALSLRKSKASHGAVMSFLISTPQTGVDSIIATYGMLGPVFAVFRPIAALVMGAVGGIVARFAAHGDRDSGELQTNGGTFECAVCDETDEHRHGLLEKLRAMVTYAYGTFLDDISLQLVVGIVISGIISYAIPDGFFAKYVNSELLGMVMVIVAGIPLYVCATASIPIAAALMMKGLSPGVAFVFLAVGPATNAATIALVGSKLGKRFVSIYLSVMVIGSVLAGLALNATFRLLRGGLPSMPAMMHDHGEVSPFMQVWVYLFSAILGLSLLRKLFPVFWYRHVASHFRRTLPEPAAEDGVLTVGIEGMTCSHCVAHVKEAIEGLDGVEHAEVNLNAKSARVVGDVDPDEVKRAVGDAGYRVM
ncbi:MAG: SO_0444 family Cu/Zn efflux transporter [Chitinivibrionales bacterium]|nr:SO_0444 family Cu/Zn efflux transporter [Chitinivibrionales bacterium]